MGIIFSFFKMYFLKQITQQFSNFFCHYFEQWPGNPGFDAQRLSEESAQREAEAARPETERLAEVDTLATESTAEMRTRMEWMRAEQWRIARAEAATAIVESGEDSASVLELVPATEDEREIAQQAIIAAWGNITDEAAINAAIIDQRWHSPGEAKETNPDASHQDIDEVMERAAEIATNLWFEEFQIESEDQAENFRRTLLEGLDLTGNESPEELEALIHREFETLRDQRLAELDALEVDINTELANPAIPPARMSELQLQRNAIRAMRNTYAPNWSINGPSGNLYAWGIGEPLTPELLAEYGATWHELASWLQSNGFPVYNGQPNYCGQNVGEALDAFGIQGLPSSGRHGFAYAEICSSRPSQFRQIDCRPQEAPAGAIISYQQNSGGSSARQQYGHVEIALWNNTWYYFGTVASAPWWSQKPPHPGSYTIWMPTSKISVWDSTVMS